MTLKKVAIGAAASGITPERAKLSTDPASTGSATTANRHGAGCLEQRRHRLVANGEDYMRQPD